ncbi:MAG: efflux RND transporter periplasmic adaptor subunit [Alphaproteobacteria bacterium]|nr:MAG: efflux RND transporter periplasmic adaptor subunit [Alphaproteobacteria bacterium]
MAGLRENSHLSLNGGRTNLPGRRWRRLAMFAGLVLVAATVGCSPGDKEAAREPADDPDQARPMPVAAIVVHYQNSYRVRVGYTGRIHAPRRGSLGFERSGRLARIMVREGDRVAAGAVLAELDTARLDAQLAELKAQHHEAEADLKLAKRTYRRLAVLHRDGHVSSQRLDEAEARREAAAARVARLAASIDRLDVELAKSRLLAPFEAVVTRRIADEGTVLAAGAPVIEVIESARPAEAKIGLPLHFAERLKTGERYPVRLEDGRTVEARLAGLVPSLAGRARTLLARLELPDGSGAIDGSLAILSLEDVVAQRGFWLPVDALTADLRGLWRVYKVIPSAGAREPARVAFENVQILHTDGRRAYVTGTLDEGDAVIAGGLTRVVPGMAVEIVERRASDGARRQTGSAS